MLLELLLSVCVFFILFLCFFFGYPFPSCSPFSSARQLSVKMPERSKRLTPKSTPRSNIHLFAQVSARISSTRSATPAHKRPSRHTPAPRSRPAFAASDTQQKHPSRENGAGASTRKQHRQATRGNMWAWRQHTTKNRTAGLVLISIYQGWILGTHL